MSTHDDQFEFHKLEVYQRAMELKPLVKKIAEGLPRGTSDLRNHLTRAERSIPLNTAEGAGKKSPGGKAERYRTARGSANECAAALDEIRIDGLAPIEIIRDALHLLHRIISMLTRLIITWESRT